MTNMRCVPFLDTATTSNQWSPSPPSPWPVTMSIMSTISFRQAPRVKQCKNCSLVQWAKKKYLKIIFIIERWFLLPKKGCGDQRGICLSRALLSVWSIARDGYYCNCHLSKHIDWKKCYVMKCSSTLWFVLGNKTLQGFANSVPRSCHFHVMSLEWYNAFYISVLSYW